MAARARTPNSARARARAPRLQPSARSGFRCHCLLPRAAACSKLGLLSAGPLAPRQEDEFEEDAWAREYRDGCGPGGNRARAKDGLQADDPPCGWLRALSWSRHPDPDRDSGQPLPQPTPEGRKEGKESASELGSPSRARAATSSLGNRCHSNGVALPSNATAGWRRPLPHHGRGRGGGGGSEGGALWGEHRSSGRSGCACLSTSRVGVRASGSVGTSRLPRGCSRRNRTPRVAANVEAAQTPGLPREEEAWRLGLGALPGDYHC